MSYLTQTYNKRNAEYTSKDKEATLLSRLSEYFWFCLSFLLFIVMGPFSAVVVVIALFSLAGKENQSKMVEPASIT